MNNRYHILAKKSEICFIKKVEQRQNEIFDISLFDGATAFTTTTLSTMAIGKMHRIVKFSGTLCTYLSNAISLYDIMLGVIMQCVLMLMSLC